MSSYETIPELWDRIHAASPRHAADATRLLEAISAYETARGDSDAWEYVLMVLEYGQRTHNLGRPVPQGDGSVRFDATSRDGGDL